MKFTKLMLAGLAMGMMTSCSQEEDLTIANSNETQGEAYMSLSIQMPDGRNTRAIDPGVDGDKGTDAGTIDEQFVSNVSIYVWEDNEQKAPVVAYFEANQLRPGKPNDPVLKPSKVTVYTTPSFAVSKGAHKVVVVVNGGNPEVKENLFATDKMTTPSFMRQTMELNFDAIQKLSKAKHFVMTNANTIISQDEDGKNLPTTSQGLEIVNNKFNADGTVGVNVTGNKDNPTTVVIPVERVVAKIEDMSSSYTMDVLDYDDHRTGDVVRFTEVNLINGNTKFFPIKNVRAQHANNVWPGFTLNPNNDYIVDPNFEKEELKVTDFYGKVEDTQAELRKTLNTKNRAHFYTLENTMVCQEQKDIYTTGLYYKASYQLDGEKQGINIYKFKGQLYTFEKLLADGDFQKDHKYTDEAGQEQIYTFTDDSSIKDFAKVGVTKYEAGVCYYPVWIRHIKQDSHLAPMEFGVVRNNYYQIFLNSVHGIGSNVPVNPDPEKPNPDETEDAMLDVAVKVLPWTVRRNEVDL